MGSILGLYMYINIIFVLLNTRHFDLVQVDGRCKIWLTGV